MSKTYLCSEGGEEFYITADSFDEAIRSAEIYNAVVIREMPEE